MIGDVTSRNKLARTHVCTSTHVCTVPVFGDYVCASEVWVFVCLLYHPSYTWAVSANVFVHTNFILYSRNKVR